MFRCLMQAFVILSFLALVPYPDGLYVAFVYIYWILHHGRSFPNDCHNAFAARGFVYKEEMFLLFDEQSGG